MTRTITGTGSPAGGGHHVTERSMDARNDPLKLRGGVDGRPVPDVGHRSGRSRTAAPRRVEHLDGDLTGPSAVVAGQATAVYSTVAKPMRRQLEGPVAQEEVEEGPHPRYPPDRPGCLRVLGHPTTCRSPVELPEHGRRRHGRRGGPEHRLARSRGRTLFRRVRGTRGRLPRSALPGAETPAEARTALGGRAQQRNEAGARRSYLRLADEPTALTRLTGPASLTTYHEGVGLFRYADSRRWQAVPLLLDGDPSDSGQTAPAARTWSARM